MGLAQAGRSRKIGPSPPSVLAGFEETIAVERGKKMGRPTGSWIERDSPLNARLTSASSLSTHCKPHHDQRGCFFDANPKTIKKPKIRSNGLMQTVCAELLQSFAENL